MGSLHHARRQEYHSEQRRRRDHALPLPTNGRGKENKKRKECKERTCPAVSQHQQGRKTCDVEAVNEISGGRTGSLQTRNTTNAIASAV